MELTEQQLNSVIHTQIGTMTVREAINMLVGYTSEDFIGFSTSMIESYIISLGEPHENN